MKVFNTTGNFRGLFSYIRQDNANYFKPKQAFLTFLKTNENSLFDDCEKFLVFVCLFACLFV